MVFPSPRSLAFLRQNAQDSIADLPALKDAAMQVAAHILHGAHGQKKAGGSEKFWQFREYSDADRPQDIDWRQSGKTEHVYVREKELQTPQSVYIWASRAAGMDFKSANALHSKAEAAQTLSLALAMLFQRGEERVGALGQKRVSNSEDGIDRIGRALLEDNDNPLPQGDVPSRSTVVLAGDFLSSLEDIEQAFTPFSGKNARGIIVQVLDIAERDLPFDGNVVFDDHADGTGSAHHKVDNVSSIRDAYKQRINDHIRGIEQLCASYGWAHVLHVTETPLEETLTLIWEGEQR